MNVVLELTGEDYEQLLLVVGFARGEALRRQDAELFERWTRLALKITDAPLVERR